MTARSRPRVRTQWLALAAALVVLAGVVVAWALDRAAARAEVLRLARPVAAGATIGRDDLAVAAVAVDAGVAGLVPVAAAAEVIGRPAAVDLMAGSLLQPGMWREGPQLAVGERSIGAVLAPGHFPEGLTVGAEAEAVDLGEVSADGRTGTANPPVTVRLLSLAESDDGSVSVTFAVAEGDGARLARSAAEDRLVLLGRPREVAE